jgi:outer membrane lipoprotein-sorting protein
MRKLIIAAVMGMTFAFGANAQLKGVSSADEAIVKSLKSGNANVTSLVCKFTETQKMSFMNTSTEKAGDFYFVKPNQLSMLYTNNEVMIINNENVTIGKKGKVRNVKSKNKQVEALAQTLLACMSGDVSLLNGTLDSAKQDAKEVSLKVKVNFTVGKSVITNLELKYDKKDMTFKSLKMIQADGSYQLYELQSKEKNKNVDAAVFTYNKK